jgi:ParB family chromosome partitioning protein
MSSRVVLGRGLEALIPQKDSKEAPDSTKAKFRTVALDKIKPNPMQPRRAFAEEALKELAESFKRDGIMQPLVVTQTGEDYTIIAGERRLRAAKLAGLTELPVVLMEETDDVRRLELALVENIQRENLNPIEVAQAYKTLIDKCGLSQEELSERVNKSRSAVTNNLRLLTLPISIQILVRDAKLTEGHARAILSLETEHEMLDLAEQIIKGSWSVRVAEEKAKSKKRRLVPKRQNPMLSEFENNLRQILGTSVKITPGLKRGKIEIEYYGNDDLERLVALLKRIH